MNLFIVLLHYFVSASYSHYVEELDNTVRQHTPKVKIDASEFDGKGDLIFERFRKFKEELQYKLTHHSIPPVEASVEFDCKIKKLAFEYAQKLSPGFRQSHLKYIFDGLTLGALCNQTFIPDQSDPDIERDFDNDVFHIFVDQKPHKEGGDGSFGKPFRDIQTGIDMCGRRKNSLFKCKVSVRGGTYYIKEPLTIKDNNIVLEAYESEDVIVTSDVVVKPTWTLYKSSMESYHGLNPIFFDGIKPNETTPSVIFAGVFSEHTTCEQKCASETKCTAWVFFDSDGNNITSKYKNQCYMRNDGKWNTEITHGVHSGKKVSIYAADLHDYDLKKVDEVFINDRRAIRARYPNANPETMGLHTVPTGWVPSAEKWLPPHPSPDALEVHIKSPIRTATLFPDFYLGIGGPVHQFDPPISYWGTKHPFGGGGVTYRVPSGLKYSDSLEIKFRSWKNPSTGIVHAYQHYHWGNWMFKLDRRDEVNRTLHWTWGGFQEARGSNDGREWYVENIFEELDSANEWFYDDDKKVLYYSPNVTAEDLPKQVNIPQLPTLCLLAGSKRRPIVNTTVRGIVFQHTTQTFLEPYTVASGGDWTVHENALMYMEDTENVRVERCTFDSPGGNGIMVKNYNRGTEIAHNVLYRLGDNGIVLVGDSHMIDGSRGNQPRGVKILYNIIFENGLWGKQSYPVVQAKSCETYLEGNVFFNGPRAGININDGFGGGNTINKNLLFNFVRETDDHGPINTWDRVPYVTRVYDGKTVSLKRKENQIHYNFIINNYRSVWPIDHDDGTCFWNDTHNYLVYGGFKNYLAHDLHSMHNVYVYPDKHSGKGASMTYPFCVQTAGQTLGKSGYGDVYRKNKCIIGKPTVHSLGSCGVAFIRELIPLMLENHYYTPGGKLEVYCGSQKWDLQQFRAHGMEIDTVIEDLVGDDEVIQWGRDLLNIE